MFWTGLLACMVGILIVSQPGPGAVSLETEPASDYQLLTNPGMEQFDPPYGQFDGVDCQVARGWQRFWYGGPEPCWMDTRVFAYSHLGTGWVERIEGETSQLIVGVQPYTAGLWQRVSGLRPGLGYGFHAALLTIFQSSALPAHDGTMIKQVGMDPTGGTDPQAPTVLWSEADDHDQGPWSVDLRIAAFAQTSTVTVFIRVISLYEAGDWPYLNLSFLDSAILAQAPVVTATSPTFSPVPTFTVRWDNAIPAPGGEVKRYDVQWLDEEEGIWHDWFTRTTNRWASFVGQQGHVYRFRARALQRYENNARLYSPYRPDGDTRTIVRGPRLIGYVFSPEGKPVGGTTVVISSTSDATLSGADGSYELDTQPWSTPQTVTVGHPGWNSPSPLYGVTWGPTETISFTWTLRPLDDVVENGEFEAGTNGWSLLGEDGETPDGVNEPVHTGRGALALTSHSPGPRMLSASQVVTVTNAWEPVLSFWYYPAAVGADDRLNVVLTLIQSSNSPLPLTTTLLFTPALGVFGWRHQWVPLAWPDTYWTGEVSVRFQGWHAGSTATAIYIDEVSLGATVGGPYKIYLPIAFKRS
ncbi:MAG: hypothetical protein ACUVWZ_04465 [Anaerolineae bacterium]